MQFQKTGQYSLELPFIGRTQELQILKAFLKSAFENQGKGLFILGDMGMGKTRLLNEFLKDIESNIMLLNVAIQPGISANLLFAEIINGYLHYKGRPIREILQVIGRDVYNRYARIIPELKLYFPFEPDYIMENELQIAHYFLEFIKNLSHFTPLVLVMENIHNGGKELYTLLEYFLKNISKMPILVVLTAHCKIETLKWIDRIKSSNIERMNLGELKSGDVLELNRLMFESHLENEFFYWLYKITTGEPLFLQEVIFALLEKGIIYYDDTERKWHTLPNYKNITALKDISEVLKSRFAGLDEEEYEFLETAAIIGESFDISTPLFKRSRVVLNNLLKTGIIKEKDRGYTFSHPIIRDIIYEEIPERKKREMHKIVGDYYKRHGNQFLAGEHFIKAGIKNLWLVNYLERLGIQSFKSRDFLKSRFFFGKALNIVKGIKNYPLRKVINIMERYTDALLTTGEYHQAIEVGQELVNSGIKWIKIIGYRQLLRGYRHLVSSLVRIGNYREAITKTMEAINLQKKYKIKKFSEIFFEIESYQAFALKYLGKTDEALSLALKLRNRINRNSPLIAQYYVFNLLGAIFNSKCEYTRAIEYRTYALKLAERLKSPSLIASAKGNLGISYINNGAFKKGEELLLEHQKFSIKAGMLREQIMDYLALGASYLYQGLLNQAIYEFQQGIRLCNETDNQADLVWLLRFYGPALFFIREYVEAEECLNQGIEIAIKLHNQKNIYIMSVYKGIILYTVNKFSELQLLYQKLVKEFKTKEDGYFQLLSGLYSTINNNKKGFGLINKGIELLEKKKDYLELFLILYFCVKFIKNNPFLREHKEKAMAIAERFTMSGWIERLQQKPEIKTPAPLWVISLGRLIISSPIKGSTIIELLNWQKLRDFLSILIVTKFKKKPITREEMGALLWPELSKKQVANNFHVCLAQIKRAIGKDYIRYQNGTYSLENIWIDALEFKNLIEIAQKLYYEGKIHLAEMKLKDALALYKGRFLEDCYHSYVSETRSMIELLYRRGLLLLSEIYLRKLRFEQTIEIGQMILGLDPFDEEGNRLLMRTYLLCNEKGKAINQYQKCAELFKRELDCLPSEETRRLYEEIKKK